MKSFLKSRTVQNVARSKYWSKHIDGSLLAQFDPQRKGKIVMLPKKLYMEPTRDLHEMKAAEVEVMRKIKDEATGESLFMKKETIRRRSRQRLMFFCKL